LVLTGGSKVEALSAYVSNACYGDIPSEVIGQAKKVVLDTLGAMIRASSRKYSAGIIITKFVEELGGKREATIVGRSFKTSAVNAALANGTMGYYCDSESHHPESITHVAAVVVPTALALTESQHLTGKDLLTAVVVGYDTETRVANALDPSELYKRGFHPSGVAGCFGAAAAAGKLLHLSVEQQTRAFGLAGCQASGLLAWCTDQTENSRPFQMGVAARNGVTSAILAKRGFGAPPDVFAGKNGMYEAFTDGPKPSRLWEELGSKFTIMEAAFKLYSCCAFIHPGADALLTILSKNNIKHADVEQISLHFPKPGAGIIDDNELKSHNAQYILAVLAVRREVSIDDILHERRSDPEISRLSQNTHLIYDEELAPLFPEKYTSIVVVRTKDGKEYSARVDYARGTEQNPVTLEEIEAKFRRMTVGELPKSKVERCIKTANRLEQVNSISALTTLLRK
jgi:2-methylcitrate dehydratase PrpD